MKSPYLSLEKVLCKNNNLPRRHASNGIFIRGFVDGKRCTDIHTSTLRVSDQYQKVISRANINFRISRGDSRFWENYFEPPQGKTPQRTESLPGNPRKEESNRQGTKQTDWEVIIHSNSSPSRQTRDSNKRKLNPTIFMKLRQIRGIPEMDLFALRVSHQLPHYISWKIDPFSQGKDTFKISWAHNFVYDFPRFALTGRVFQKVNQDQCLMLIITPA